MYYQKYVNGNCHNISDTKWRGYELISNLFNQSTLRNSYQPMKIQINPARTLGS